MSEAVNQNEEYVFKNEDIDFMLGKMRRIRCMHCPRYSVYDKVSKTTIILDSDICNMGKANHVAWKTTKKIGYYNGFFPPQADFKAEHVPMKQALDMVLDVARKGELETYKLVEEVMEFDNGVKYMDTRKNYI